MRKMNSRLIVFAVLLGLIGAGLIYGCGKKSWPTPPGAMDSFSWGQVNATVIGSCIVISAQINGNRNNLEEVTLQLSVRPPDEDCAGCPFAPTESHPIVIDRVALFNSPKDSRLRINFCPERPLSPDMLYRARLVGHNVYPTLENAVSQTMSLMVPKTAETPAPVLEDATPPVE